MTGTIPYRNTLPSRPDPAGPNGNIVISRSGNATTRSLGGADDGGHRDHVLGATLGGCESRCLPTSMETCRPSKAVLGEVEDSGVDRIVLLGDIAGRPRNARAKPWIAWLAWATKAIWVHGNGERETGSRVSTARCRRDRPATTAAACVPLLNQRQPRADGCSGRWTVTVDIDGLGPTLFCHATPRRDERVSSWSTHPSKRWEQVLQGVDEQGRRLRTQPTCPFDRLVNQRRVVKPGSVGMAYGPSGVLYWAVLGPTVELRRNDVRRPTPPAERIKAGGHPNAAAWAEQYVLRPYGGRGSARGVHGDRCWADMGHGRIAKPPERVGHRTQQ